MEKDTLKIIIKEKKWISDNLFFSQHGSTIGSLFIQYILIVSMWVCFSPGFCSVNVLYLSGLCICSMCF